MNFNTLLRSAAPHAISLIGGFCLVILFFSPIFFENKTLDQNDVKQGVGSGIEVQDFRAETGEEALWTNSMFSGMPAYLINISYSGELVKYAHKIISMNLPSSAQVIFLAFVSFYILLLTFKVRPLFAFIGAVAFAFNTFNLISVEAGHIWKVRAIAYMPLVVSGVNLIFSKTKEWLGLGLLSLAVALEIHANHLQITYYLLLFLIIYGVIQLIVAVKENQLPTFLRKVAFLLIAGIVGVGANSARIWTTLEYSKYSTRGTTELTAEVTGESKTSGLDRDYVFNWSYGVLESLTLVVPNFSGGASTMALDESSNLGQALLSRGVRGKQLQDQLANVPTYWGDQPIVAGPSYAGAIMFFLFVLGLFVLDKKIKYWLVAATVLGLLLAWGKNFESFNYLMYDYFPGYNKFRSVSMAMVILLLAVPLQGVLALEKWFLNTGKNKQKDLLLAGCFVAGICLLLFLLSFMLGFRGAVDAQLSQLPTWYVDAIKADRQSMLSGDAIRSLVLVLISIGCIYAYYIGKIKYAIAGSILAVLTIFDFLTVGGRFIDDSNYMRKSRSQLIEMTPADQEIKRLAGDSHYRVLNLQNPFNEAFTSAFHSSIGGYHGAKMKRYQELITYGISNEMNDLIESLRSGNPNFEDQYILNMLNTKFIKYGPAKENIMPNPAAFGNAWLVTNVEKVNSADDEILALQELSTRTTAVINVSKFDDIQDQYQGKGSIQLLDYKPNKLVYQANLDEKGLACFSEIYYPEGWSAKIDGNEAEIIQANYVLRALDIPEGSHEIVFEFQPDSYFIGNKLNYVFSILMFGLFGFGVFRAYK